jgi:hypothetical protein
MEVTQMSKLKVLICEVDEQDENKMKELARFDVADVDMGNWEAATGLDDLENSTESIGQQVKRKLLQARWEQLDKRLSTEYRQRFSP